MASFSLNYTGLRIADAIAGALSTNRTAYSNASNGQSVEITATEYANLMTLSGTAKYGSTDAHMATATVPNGGGAFNNTTQSYLPTAFNGTYFASNQYLIAFSFKSCVANASMNYQGCKIKWGDNSYTTLNNYTTIASSVPAGVYVQKYFVVKGATLSPAVARFAIYQSNQTVGNTNDLIGGGASVISAKYAATGDVNTGLSTTASTVYSPAFIQGIMTPTKQW